MQEILYAVYGASGYGREVMPMARHQLAQAGVPAGRLVFVDDRPDADIVNGQRVLTYAQFMAEKAAARCAVLAIAGGAVREKLALRCAADGVRPGAWPPPTRCNWTMLRSARALCSAPLSRSQATSA